MPELPSLIPIRQGDLVIGKPLRRAIYDAQGKLLLASGFVLENENQVNNLLENGFFPDAGGVAAQSGDATAASSPSNAGGSATAGESGAAGKEIVVEMDSVRWTVGESIYLQALGSPGLRYNVRLIGYVKNRTVFVTAPMADGKFELIREGVTFVARAFSGKKAYAFMASAVKSVHTPHPYLHLTYPKQVRCNVVRQAVRAEVKIIAALEVGSRTGAGMLTDLSVGGASATLKEPLGAKGDASRVKFKLQAVGQEELLNVEAILRWVGPAESGDGFKHGFEFVNAGLQERLILSAFVHQTLVDSL